MKKNTFTFILFLIIGLITGAILTELLSPVKGISFLTHSAPISWTPKADLQVIQYDLRLMIKLNLMSILSVAAAIWIYRKL